jgi:hypothetical protein
VNAGLANLERRDENGAPDATAVAAARKRLARWLLESGAQLTTGPHAGGVAGWIDGGGHAAYVYPEITGYYLQWLAWHATHEGATPIVKDRAAAAQRWLASWIARGDPPPTRVYLRLHEADWRNGVLFFFDLAMIARGVAAAVRTGLIEVEAVLVRDLVGRLSDLVDSDGMFAACATTSRAALLPASWSTRRGGFLAKAAAGVLAATEVLPALASLRPPAQATFSASLALAIRQPHADAHPALYAMEGALCAPNDNLVAALLPRFAAQLEIMLAPPRNTGMLHDSRLRSGVDRLDVVAQGLRAAALLESFATGGPARAQALASMTQLLVRCTRATGALPFSPTVAAPQYNTWCAMFAEQALCVAHPWQQARTLAQLPTLLV